MASPRTIALIYNDDFYLHRFKGGLLRALVAAGDTVYAIAPAGKTVEARYRAREAEPGGRRGLKKVERPLAVGLERSATESRCLDRFGLDD